MYCSLFSDFFTAVLLLSCFRIVVVGVILVLPEAVYPRRLGHSPYHFPLSPSLFALAATTTVAVTGDDSVRSLYAIQLPSLIVVVLIRHTPPHTYALDCYERSAGID